VDLEPEHVQTYAKSDISDANSFLVKIPIVDDIFIQPSIFVFHGMNSVYFIFQEIRSILRKGGSATRKRVLIGDDNNKTRKNLNN
jgi:succinate dehydrogenase/fumarate reductase cytochrome b subunit